MGFLVEQASDGQHRGRCRGGGADRCGADDPRGGVPHDGDGVRGGGAGHRGPLGRLCRAGRDPVRAAARGRAQGRDHDLRPDPGQRAARRHRPCGGGRGVLPASDAGDVRLPELHLDPDLPAQRRLLRHAVRHRPAAGPAEHAGDGRHVQAVRPADRLPSRCPGAAGDERGSTAQRAAGDGAARAVHRRARARPAQSRWRRSRRRHGCCATSSSARRAASSSA